MFCVGMSGVIQSKRMRYEQDAISRADMPQRAFRPSRGPFKKFTFPPGTRPRG